MKFFCSKKIREGKRKGVSPGGEKKGNRVFIVEICKFKYVLKCVRVINLFKRSNGKIRNMISYIGSL